MKIRKLKRDWVISMTDKGDSVGVYYADTKGNKILFEATPEVADKIIKLHNTGKIRVSGRQK